MKALLVSCLAMLTMVPIAFAQDRSDHKAEIKAHRDALRQERQNGPGPNANVSPAAVTAADVGEPDSFGRNAKFLGIAASGAVLIDPTCDPADIGPLGPDDHCITVPDPSVPVPATTFSDVARITIPGKSADNIIYAIANHTISFDLINTDAASTQCRISYAPSVTIESEALNDPSLIDPTTGLPFNGSFTTGGVGTYSTNKMLASGAFEFQTQSYSRANTTGFSRSFFAGLGLPDHAINQLYKKPMTIRLNVRVSSRCVDSAVLIFTIRFLGN
ncbi:MAG TPA: hypothetical protein VLT85_03920 [Terriglobales bacterium]|nr:hypothetical protein [Terriglobales bacterium]